MSQPLYNAAKVLLVPDWISREEELVLKNIADLLTVLDAHPLRIILNLFLYFNLF